MKKFLIILMISILSVCFCSLFGCNKTPDGNQTQDDTPSIPPITAPIIRFCETYDEMGLPADIQRWVGLSLYNPETQRYVSVKDDISFFNPELPCIFYAHGQSSEGPGGADVTPGLMWNSSTRYEDELDEIEDYLAEDYNVLSFTWGPYTAFDNPWYIQDNIWTMDAGQYYAPNSPDKKDDYHAYCAAEMFGISIYDFLSRFPNYDLPYRLVGLSMGGQLVLACTSYLDAVVNSGRISARYLPERTTMCDPFINNTDGSKDYRVSWLGETVGNSGSVGLIIRVSNKLHADGVTVDYLHTGKGDAARSASAVNDTLEYITMWNSTDFIDYDVSFVGNMYNPISETIDYFSSLHTCCVAINAYLNYHGIVDDVKYEGELGFGEKTPLSYAMARVGTVYRMNTNTTPYVDDDEQYATLCYVDDTHYLHEKQPLTTAKVAGLVFEDKNDNGICDENMSARINDVEVYLYANGAKVMTTKSKGGYYEFVLDSSYNGKTLTVSFATPTGKSIANTATVNDRAEKGYLMTNEFESETSDEFSFEDVAGHIKIVNIGLK